ncbi:MAG: glycosyltransferase family protein [Mobilitalea sp.]
MMKKIVFIVDNYYPNYSAVGVCINNVIQELAISHDVIVITKKHRNDNQNFQYDNHYIIYYNTMDTYARNYILNKISSSNGIKRKAFKIAKLVIRGFGYLDAILKKTNIKRYEVRGIYNALKIIDGTIDVIIPTCLPMESLIASIDFKNIISNNTKIIPFLFDKFSANSTLHRTERNKRIKFLKHLAIENMIFDKCEKLIFVDSWLEHLNKYFIIYKNKFVQVEHPLLKKIVTTENMVYDNQRINIVYTGALYKKIRSPLYALLLLEKLIKKNNKITLHFYITGDCNSIINKYCDKYPDNIKNYGSVSTDMAKAAILSADILLSLGNSDVTQLPSKIFEYISTGNPILHFYSHNEDAVIGLLSRYINSCCISNSIDYNENIEKISLEKINNFGDKLEFNEVERIYIDASPKYIAKKIIELF